MVMELLQGPSLGEKMRLDLGFWVLSESKEMQLHMAVVQKVLYSKWHIGKWKKDKNLRSPSSFILSHPQISYVRKITSHSKMVATRRPLPGVLDHRKFDHSDNCEEHRRSPTLRWQETQRSESCATKIEQAAKICQFVRTLKPRRFKKRKCAKTRTNSKAARKAGNFRQNPTISQTCGTVRKPA